MNSPVLRALVKIGRLRIQKGVENVDSGPLTKTSCIINSLRTTCGFAQRSSAGWSHRPFSHPTHSYQGWSRLQTSLPWTRNEILASSPGAGGPANIVGRHHRDRASLRGEAGYLRDTFGRFHTRFRFALLFSRAFFVGLCIDLFRKFGQFFVSFCFFFERLLQ